MRHAVPILFLKLAIVQLMNFPSDIVRLPLPKIYVLGHHIWARGDGNTLRPNELKELRTYLTEDTLQDFIKAEETVEVTAGIDGLSVETGFAPKIGS